MTDKPNHNDLRQRWLDSTLPTAWDGYQWWRYIDNHWQLIERTQVRSELDAVVIAAQNEGITPNAWTVNSLYTMAEDKLGKSPKLFNANPDLLVCQNGVLKLSTRVLSPHSPDHYATSILPYAYDIHAMATRWQYFLDTTLERSVIDFLQEFTGYCLTTDTKYETAVWLCGPRGSGKSTFLLGLTTMLGKMAGLLGLAEIERSRFALCDVPGKTLLFATEQPLTATGATSILNRLISGEPIRVEKKFKDAFEIIPRAKVCWAMNELPMIANSHDGIFRRVKVVQFQQRATPVIPEIKEQIALEGAGILNWALTGLDRLTARGEFAVPDSVAAATIDYEHTSDFTALFIDECCELHQDHTEQAEILYGRYRDWCNTNGHEKTRKSSTAMAEEWRRFGLVRYRADGKTRWRGIKVNWR